jgi:hypothetical protein
LNAGRSKGRCQVQDQKTCQRAKHLTASEVQNSEKSKTK